MEFFPDEIGAITERFDAWTAALQKEGGPDAAVVDQYVQYLQHYRCGGRVMITLCTLGAARCRGVGRHDAVLPGRLSWESDLLDPALLIRNCLAEPDIDKLEPMWTELDEKWCDNGRAFFACALVRPFSLRILGLSLARRVRIKYTIDVVPDIGTLAQSMCPSLLPVQRRSRQRATASTDNAIFASFRYVRIRLWRVHTLQGVMRDFGASAQHMLWCVDG